MKKILFYNLPDKFYSSFQRHPRGFIFGEALVLLEFTGPPLLGFSCTAAPPPRL